MHTFTLLFEEFLEPYQGYLPSVSFAQLCLTGIISLVSTAFCIVLIYTTTDMRLGSGSLFALLVLSLLVPLLLNERVNHRRRQHLGNLQSVYEQSYSGERVFFFDEKSWVLQTRSGRQEVVWSSIVSAIESESTVTLFCPDQLVLIVPKRVFTPEEISSLKGHAIGENHGFQSKISVFDYVWSQAPRLWEQHPIAMTLLHVAGLGQVLFLTMYVRTDSAFAASFGWTFCVGLFLIVATLQFGYLALKYEDTARYFFDNWRVQFSKAGVHIRAKGWESFSSWNLFPKMVEGSRCFVLQTTGADAFIISKKLAPPEQQAEFRRHLVSCVSNTKKQPG